MLTVDPAKNDPNAANQLWHKYTTWPDPFEATDADPAPPDTGYWSEPSMFTVDVAGGPLNNGFSFPWYRETRRG
jgi:hypothetical protein